jgi:hypothetical protein
MLAGACPHDCRSGNDRNLGFSCARPLQFVTEFADDRRLRFVGINDCVDELKEISTRGRTLNRNDTNPVMSHHNFIIFTDIEKLDRPGSAFLSVNRNCAVHHGGPDFDVLALKSNKCLLVGCHVEIGRKNSVRRRAGQLGIHRFGGLGPVLSQAQNQFVERFAAFGRDLDSCEAWIRPLFANLDFSDLKIRAVGQNLIQHLRQNERIDNVPA